MRNKITSEEQANKIYDILVTIGADESDRLSFVYHHCKDKYKEQCIEWRFSGKLGFGGKYRSSTNTVTYYSEDETLERKNIRNNTNELLKKI